MSSSRLAMLAIDANRIAHDHGFWDVGHSSSPHATKVALIHTEIAELGEELADRRHNPSPGADQAVADELADIVIRTADLAQAMKVPQHLLRAVPACSEPGPANRELFDLVRYLSTDSVLVRMHREAAGITQANRKDQEEVAERQIIALLSLCWAFSWVLRLDLWYAVEAKMERNRQRPRLHGGRRY